MTHQIFGMPFEVSYEFRQAVNKAADLQIESSYEPLTKQRLLKFLNSDPLHIQKVNNFETHQLQSKYNSYHFQIAIRQLRDLFKGYDDYETNIDKDIQQYLYDQFDYLEFDDQSYIIYLLLHMDSVMVNRQGYRIESNHDPESKLLIILQKQKHTTQCGGVERLGYQHIQNRIIRIQRLQAQNKMNLNQLRQQSFDQMQINIRKNNQEKQNQILYKDIFEDLIIKNQTLHDTNQSKSIQNNQNNNISNSNNIFHLKLQNKVQKKSDENFVGAKRNLDISNMSSDVIQSKIEQLSELEQEKIESQRQRNMKILG